MNKRKITISAVGIGILLLSFVLAGQLKREEPDRRPKPGELATAVSSIEVSPGEVHRAMPITGRLVPRSTVNLYAEVSGVASFGEKPFKPGVRFRKGDILLKINADEMESSLAAARSNFQSQLAGVIPDLKIDFADEAEAWSQYLERMDIKKSMAPLPEVKDRKLQLFLSGRNMYSNYYGIKEAETRLAKHVLRAPFDGSVVETDIDDASLVRIGQALGSFISSGHYELEAGVSYRDIGALQVGTRFEMRDVNTGKTYEAKVVRINEAVDPLTQQVKIYAEVNDVKARSGIYLEGNIAVEQYANAVQVPAQALVGERAVFVVRDSLAVLQAVQVLHKTAETATLSGFDAKVQVITSRHNEAFAGSKVAITNIDRP